jgi:hypothetical protein
MSKLFGVHSKTPGQKQSPEMPPLKECHMSVNSHDLGSFSCIPRPQLEHVFTQGLGN